MPEAFLIQRELRVKAQGAEGPISNIKDPGPKKHQGYSLWETLNIGYVDPLWGKGSLVAWFL